MPDRTNRLVAAAGIMVFVGLVLLGLWVHPFEAATAEMDGFVAQAETLLAGKVPRDPHRPLLYVCLTALLAALTGGDCFVAGKVVAAAGGAVAMYATWLLGRQVFGVRVGALAAGLLVVNGVVLTESLQATTDSLFLAFTTLCSWVALRASRQPGSTPAVWVGLCLGLAWFTRYTAVALVPVAALALALGERGIRACARRLLLAAAVAFVVMIPQGALSWVSMGTPFHQEAWRSVAFRHFGAGDWRYLDDNPFDGLLAVLRHDPAAMVGNAWATAISMVQTSLPSLLHGGHPWSGAWILLLPAAGLVVLLGRDRRAGLLVGLALASMLGLLIFAFFDWVRFELPVLPILYVLAAGGVFRGIDALVLGLRIGPRLASWAVAAATLLGVIAVAREIAPALRRFAALHPWAQVAFARDLVRAHGPELVLLADHPHLGHAASCRCHHLNLRTEPAGLVEDLQNMLWQLPGDYLLLSRLYLGPDGMQVLATMDLPPTLQLVHASSELRCYRIVRRHLSELAAGAPSVAASGTDGWLLSVALRDTAPATAAVAAFLRGPGRRERSVVLGPGSGGMRTILIPRASLRPGSWRVQFFASDGVGAIFAGPELELVVAR